MRKNKRALLVCLIILSMTQLISAQCIPDTFPSPGFYPDSMTGLETTSENAMSYSAVMNYKSIVDTTISIPLPPFVITVPVDSFRLISISGLPATFSFACSASNCTIYGNPSDPPGSNTLCWEISGDPSIPGVGIYNLSITIRTWITVPIVGVQVFDIVNTDYAVNILPYLSVSMEILDSYQFIKGLQKGIILQDDNGKCWKFTAGTDGNIVSEIVTCPE